MGRIGCHGDLTPIFVFGPFVADDPGFTVTLLSFHLSVTLNLQLSVVSVSWFKLQNLTDSDRTRPADPEKPPG